MSTTNTRTSEGAMSAAVRVVVAYAVFAALWIGLSDTAVSWLVRDPAKLAIVSMVKGWAFVAITAALLYVLLNRQARRQQQAFAAERAALQQQSRASSLLRALSDASTDALFVKDLQGRYLLRNLAAVRYSGITQEQSFGRDDAELFPPEMAEALRANDQKVLQTGVAETFEEEVATTEGPRIFLVTKGPLRDDTGKLFGLYGISRDVTERHRGSEALRERELEFRTLTEQMPAISYRAVIDEVFTTLYVSPRIATIGYTPGQWVKDPDTWLNALHPEDRERVLAEISASLAVGDEIKLDYRLRDGDGRWHHFHDTAGRVRGSDGRPDQLHGVMVDITSRVEAEEARREAARRAQESAQRYWRVFMTSPLPMLIHHFDTQRFLAVNRAAVALYGWSNEEFQAMTVFDACDPSQHERLRQSLVNPPVGAEFKRPWRHLSKDGRTIEVEVWRSEIEFGGLRARVSTINDVTESLRTARALREREQEFRTLAEQTPGIIYRCALDERSSTLWVSPGVASLGYTPQQWTDDPAFWSKLVHPDDFEDALSHVLPTMPVDVDVHFEYRLRDASGRWRHIRDTARRVSSGGEQADFVYGVMFDATEAVEAEALLRASEARLRLDEERYRLLFDANPLPMWVFDRETQRVLSVNDIAVEKYGWTREEFLGMTIADVLAAEDRPRLLERLGNWSPERTDPTVWTHVLKDGRRIEAEVTSVGITINGRDARLVQAQDVTERSELDRQRQEAQARAVAASQRLHNVLEQLTGGFCTLDRDWRITYINPLGARLMGRERPEELIGRNIWAEYPMFEGGESHRAFLHAQRTQRPTEIEAAFDLGGRVVWHRNHIYPSEDGLSVFFSDVTQRRETKAALERSELRYRLASARGQVWDWDIAAGERIRFPDAFWQLMGYPPPAPDDAPPNLEALLPAEQDVQAWRHALREHLARRVPFNMEQRAHTRDGSDIWFQAQGEAVWNEAGRATYMAGTLFDITQRKRAEVALREAEAYQRALFEQIGDGVFVFSQERIVDANSRGLEMLGYSAGELDALPMMQILPGHEKRRLQHILAQDLSGLDYRGDWDIQRKDGSLFPAEITARRLSNSHVIAVVRDISERREREQTLRQLSQAVEQSSESIVITNLDAEVQYVNAAALANTGYARDEIVGKNANVLQSGKTPRSTYEDLWATLLSGQAWKGIFHNRRKDGTDYDEFAVISPIRGRDGRVVNYLAVKEDVTEKRRMGEELDEYRHHLEELVERRTVQLERATRAAEAASEAKSAFLAAMSHEIRTPMNGVVGIVDVLRQSNLSPYQIELTETIRESAFGLLGIIDDILDFSKIEARRLTLEPAPLELLRVIEGACDALQPLASSRNVRLRVFVDPRLPCWITSDSVRLRQIVNNLVSNGIKFSARPDRAGHVQVRAEPVGGGQLRLQVIDDGIGMTTDAQLRIFQPFEQAESSTTRRYGGTGLGLTICRALVELFNGTIAVQSAPGEGSTFTVMLPIQATPGAQTREPVRDLSGLDCHVMLRDLQQAQDWCDYLAAAGASAQAWPDLPTLQEAIDDSDDDQPVVIVEADDEDSFAQLRTRNDGRELALVCITRGQRRSARLAGPSRVNLDSDSVHHDALIKAVALVVGGQSSEFGELTGLPAHKVAPPGVEEAAAQGRLILVAEDNDINRKVIRHQLSLLGLAAEIASDGVEALAHWRRGQPSQRYGLLLTDLHMPGLDGYELAATIRAEEGAGQHLPIVALTANALRGEAARCREIGMDDFLSKPVQLESLSTTMENWLPPVQSTTPAASTPASTPALDHSALAKLIGADADLLAEFRRDYLVSARASADELRAAAAQGDWAQIGSVAHRLKSSSRAVGAMELGECCERLEYAGKARDTASARMLMASFEAALEAVVEGFTAARERAPGGTPTAFKGALLVDDDPFHLKMLERQLSSLGVTPVKTVRSGAMALDWLQVGDTSALLLLLDLNMPGMDGVEFMRHLAELRFAGALALVSGADIRVLETASKLAKAYQLNVLSHLRKPVETQGLRELIERWRGYKPMETRRKGKTYERHEIERAIDEGELLLHYQPKVALADGALVGVEALVRWQHPVDGLVYPDSFIGTAELHGLIDGLTRNVLTQALAQLRRWRAQRMQLQMAVNVSMDNLSRLEFSEFVFAELARHGVPPTELALEVTESQLVHDVRAQMDILTRLRLKQVGLSIDDFGTGHSSLSQLRDIPFNELKIDRGFVHGSREQATQRAIFAASLAMAHQLEMKAVAEGVEDRADWDFVRAAGCDIAQGYFIARPMPADDLPVWATQWQRRFDSL